MITKDHAKQRAISHIASRLVGKPKSNAIITKTLFVHDGTFAAWMFVYCIDDGPEETIIIDPRTGNIVVRPEEFA